MFRENSFSVHIAFSSVFSVLYVFGFVILVPVLCLSGKMSVKIWLSIVILIYTIMIGYSITPN